MGMSQKNLPRWSLALVWLGTAVASLHDGGHAGAALLRPTGLGATEALAVVWLGSAWDAALGLALLLRPGRLTCLVAAAGVIAMTVIATFVLPALWLAPFGPLLKNLPLLVLLRQMTLEEEKA